MPKRALLVGLNRYANARELHACVADATDLEPLLHRNVDGSLNYECRTLCDVMEDGSPITRAALRGACRELFENFDGDALLYFSGHGVLTETGGHLCAFDSAKDDWGVPMDEVLNTAIKSKAANILVIADCCHSGDFANPSLLNAAPTPNPLSLLRENMTVIAASRDVQESVEAGGHGLFTAALIDGLKGGAADHMGWVTAPALYSYIERRFGSWDVQRPVFKTNASRVPTVRECAPLIDRFKLQRLPELFPSEDFQYRLDPEYEPEDEKGNVQLPVNEEKRAVAILFKEYRDAGLLKPTVQGEQLFWSARNSSTVELTTRGREYWWLVRHDKI